MIEESAGQEAVEPDRQQNHIVKLRSPSAARLADLVSIHADLLFISGCCERLMAQLALPEESRDFVLIQALWSAALVSYRRCFSDGKRGGLTNADVRALGLAGEPIEVHQFLHQLRNKHVAHSVNPFET